MNESPASTGSRFPTFARFRRWFFSWRGIGRLLVALGVLATLIALVSAEEAWRGNRAWQNYVQQATAKGEKLELEAFIPPPVPDDQNFTMTPFLAPVLDFNPNPRSAGQSLWRDTNGYNRVSKLQSEVGTLQSVVGDREDSTRNPFRLMDLQAWARALTGKTNATPAPAMTRPQAAAEVLEGLNRFSPVMDELRQASQRPYARFNIRYTEDSVLATLLPHLATMKSAVILFRLRACAELAADQPGQACADTEMALYLAQTIKDEPFLISQLVRASLVQFALQPIWEGLVEGKWREEQLTLLEQRLGTINLLSDAAMRGERAAGIRAVVQARQGGSLDVDNPGNRTPGAFLFGGFFYQNQLSIARAYDEFFLPGVDAANQRLFPSRVIANEAALQRSLEHGFKPYHIYAIILVPSIAGAQCKLGFAQTRVNEAILGCALERYRLAKGQYPASLHDLSPTYVTHLPHDLITGAPLQYQRTPDARYVLYSVGWNERDDGGGMVAGKGTKPSLDLTQGDWVWSLTPDAVGFPNPAAKGL